MLEAHCNCRAIKITTDATPGDVLLCHCTDCRGFTGSLCAVYLPFPKDKVTITGLPSAWEKKADSGRKFERFFCGSCGSSLYDIGEVEPDALYLHGGTLPPGAIPAPKMAIFARNKEQWEPTLEGCKVFPGAD